MSLPTNTILLLLLATTASFAVASSSPFMCGMSGSSGGIQTTSQLVQDFSVTHERRYIMWRYAQPEIKKADFDFNLTVGAVEANPAKHIDEWSATVPRWAGLDRVVDTLCSDLKKATGGPSIMPVLEVFEGTTSGLPHFIDGPSPSKTKYVDPCTVGHDAYLGHIYRWVRAVTRRYVPMLKRNCSSSADIIFQAENEFNEVVLASVYGQRPFCASYFNFSFVTEILSVLRAGIKDEDTSVLVTQNLHTDIPKSFHEMLHLPGFYLDAAKAIWSIDAYPNMVQAWPIQGHVVGERIRNMSSAVEVASALTSVAAAVSAPQSQPTPPPRSRP